MKKWKCCLTAIVIAAGSMLVGCQESSSAKPIEAMYIPAGEDGHLMVGEGTGNVFTVTMRKKNLRGRPEPGRYRSNLRRRDHVGILSWPVSRCNKDQSCQRRKSIRCRPVSGHSR